MLTLALKYNDRRLSLTLHSHSDLQDLDTQRSEIVSKRVFDAQVLHSHIARHEPTGLPESNLNTRYKATKNDILSPPDSPSGICDASRNAFDDIGYAEAQLFTRTNPFFCTEGNELEWPNTFLDAVHLLPRSSPPPSSLQSSDNSILDLDTSPWAAIRPGRSDDLSEDDVGCVEAASLRPIPRPIFRQPLQSSPIHEDLTGMDEAQFSASSFTKEPEAKRSRTIWCDDGRAFPPTGNHVFQPASTSESKRSSIRVLTRGQVTEDDAPCDIISIDFLSDPNPWVTIGNILKLKPPEPSAARSVEINFTKDRKGVGYVSPERSGICDTRSFNATSIETRIHDKLPDDIHAACNADPPILNLEASTVDNCVAPDTPDSPRADNSRRPLFHAGPPVTNRSEVNPYIHVHALQDALLIPVIHCTQNEQTRSPAPLAVIVETTAAEPDFDMTFDGPCLFGESDMEEDE